MRVRKKLKEYTHVEEVDGGRYAVFSVPEEPSAETFRMLTRYAFGTWISDNRWRVDMKRRTFVSVRGKRMFFNVPIVR